MAPRWFILPCLLALLWGCTAPAMESIRVAPGGRGFVLHPSGTPFTPWGMNYASNNIEDRWDSDWPGVERDLAELKRLGANVLRIHLQFNRFMSGPDQPRAHALAQLGRFLRLAEADGIYLDITGLACYTPANHQAWYDALDEPQRWAAQERFWRAVAHTCAASPAVFCYDLMNEPVSPAGGTRKRGAWYSGKLFGGYDYLQWIALDQRGHPRDMIARDWIHALAGAIRREDRRHLVTVGLLPTLYGKYFFGFVPATIAPELDFISVHIYPDHKAPGDAMRVLRQFVVPGKPLVVEETYPLSCTPEELREFFRASRGVACGWIGHYLDKTEAALEAEKRAGTLSIGDAMGLGWFHLFREMKAEMTAGIGAVSPERDHALPRQ